MRYAIDGCGAVRRLDALGALGQLDTAVAESAGAPLRWPPCPTGTRYSGCGPGGCRGVPGCPAGLVMDRYPIPPAWSAAGYGGACVGGCRPCPQGWLHPWSGPPACPPGTARTQDRGGCWRCVVPPVSYAALAQQAQQAGRWRP